MENGEVSEGTFVEAFDREKEGMTAQGVFTTPHTLSQKPFILFGENTLGATNISRFTAFFDQA